MTGLSPDQVLFFALFVGATLTAALVAGLAGFAFGIIAAAVWLHILSPAQTVALIVSYGLIVQGYAVWKLRHALSWSRLWPFLLGGVPGVALGIFLLEWTNPAYVRAVTGAVLVMYSLYALARPALKSIQAGVPADLGIGFLNGMLGGMTGLAGIVVVVWSGLRGWSKDVQRTVFQPVGVAIFVMSAIGLGTTGVFTFDIAKLFLLGLPVLLLGTWLGLKLYGRLDEAAFRKIVLALLLVSGIALFLSLT